MAHAKSLDDVRAVLDRHRMAILDQHSAVGVGIGRRPSDGAYVIAVYLPSSRHRPAASVEIEGVPIRFEVTGRIRPLI